jgi:hypothetical protein
MHPSAWKGCSRKSATLTGLGQAQKSCLGVAEPALRVEPAQVRLEVYVAESGSN